MKHLLLLISLTFSSVILSAQALSKEQALDYADQLYEIQILSENGKTLLKKYINISGW